MRRREVDTASFTPVLSLTERGGIKCLFWAIDSKHHTAAYPSSYFLSQREKTQQEDREQGNEEGLEINAIQEALQLRRESVWSPCSLAPFQFLTPYPSVAWLPNNSFVSALRLLWVNFLITFLKCLLKSNVVHSVPSGHGPQGYHWWLTCRCRYETGPGWQHQPWACELWSCVEDGRPPLRKCTANTSSCYNVRDVKTVMSRKLELEVTKGEYLRMQIISE